MSRLQNARETVLKASRAYYAHRAYYEDLLTQRQRRFAKTIKRELDFLEHTFRADATRPIKEVLDVACGNGPHVIGLASRGYKCTGLEDQATTKSQGRDPNIRRTQRLTLQESNSTKNASATDMLKVVSFDVVGTLTDSSYEDYVWNEAIPHLYARKRGISLKEAKNYVLKEYDRIGNKDIRWYLPEHWFKHFNLDEDPADVFRSHADKVKFYTEVAPVLRNLSQKYDLIIASGATRSAIETMIERFRHYFKHIYSPVSDRQEMKKTPQFYEMICRTLKNEPCSMAHVGDEWYSDFISPRRIGIKSFYLDRTGEKKGKFVIRDLTELEDCLSQFHIKA